MLKTMRVRSYVAFFFVVGALTWSAIPFVANAETITVYTQSDDSGEILSQQPNFQNTWIAANLGNLTPGKDRLTITFTMKDPNASNVYGTPTGVALGTCATCQDLQTYLFTDADRTLLTDGAFHTFTVQTGTTTHDDADGTIPIYITFFGLSQYHNSTHLKSSADGTIPALIIETPSSVPAASPVPDGYVTVYAQSDKTVVMTNPQATFQNAYVDSASLGNLNVGQDELYLTFMMKDPNASNVYGQPAGVCLEPAGTTDCTTPLQTYRFTDADRTLLADGGFHIFTVKTGTTTSTYADGTQPVAVGFFGLSQYQNGTKIKSNAEGTVPYLTIQAPPPPDPCATPGACSSNVLFLPGIKGSHLYRPGDGCDASLPTCENRVWEPGLDEGLFSSLLRGSGNDDVRDLFLDASGASVRSDIYVKERDVLDSAGGKEFYTSFVADMDGLKADGTIADWEPVAYDWRLSLPDIVEKGKKTGDRISYLEATSTPYIEQELRRLAASSKTGKVSIVAHSNGGLVAKALLERLGASEAAALVDNLIFVGVPQSGAPRAVGALLYGAGEGLPFEHFDFLLSKAVAREFSEYSPMAYHLLPSTQYFADASDPSHAVGTFDGTAGFEKERAAYGSTLDTADELYDFLLAREGGREKPAASEASDANVLDETLLDYARDTHTATDAWLPPAGVTLYQIAGWGVDTVAGLRFIKLPSVPTALAAFAHQSTFSPTFVEDGDGVVPVPSALMISTTSPNVRRYWVDLREYNKHHTNVKHGNLFEIQELRDFVYGIFNGTDSLPEFIKLTQPSSQTVDKKLVFILHSPLTLQLQDSSGNTTGLSGDDSVTQDIPGATYGEFGDVQYIVAPEGDYTLSMNGQAEGVFSLEMQEMSGDTVTSSATIANVPTTENTLASLTISGGVDTASPLSVDEDGDGSSDISIAPEEGEIVNYEAPASASEPAASSSGGGGGDISTTITVAPEVESEVETATSSPPAVIQPVVATSTPEVATSTTLVRVEELPPPIPVSVQKSQKTAPSPEGLKARVPQTASVYEASQQPLVARLGRAVYNGLHGFWLALKRFF